MKILILNSRFNLLKSFGVYTFVNVFHSSIPLSLPFILSSILKPEDFGILTNINSLFLVCVPLIGFSASSAISRQFVKKEINIPEYMGNIYILGIVTSTFYFLLIFLFKNKIIENFKVNEIVIYTVCIYAFTHNIIEMIFSFWRMENNLKKYSIFRMSKSLLELPLTFFLVKLVGNWEGRYFTIIGLNLIFATLITIILIYEKKIKINFKLHYMKHLIVYGLPLIPHALSGVVIMYSDKILISNYISVRENGIYSISFQIGMIISLLQNSFNQAWVPWFFKKIENDSNFNTRKTMVKYNYLYFSFLLLMLLLLIFISPFIFSFLGDNYIGGLKVIWIIGLGFVFNGMYKMLVNYIFFLEKNKLIFYITLLTALSNILLNLYLIPKIGIIGSALSFMLSCLIELLLTWFLSNSLFPLPWLFFLKSNNNIEV